MPIIKNPGSTLSCCLNTDQYLCYSFFKKFFELVVAKKLTAHLDKHNLLVKFHSGFRSWYTTETAIVRIDNEILSSIDGGKLTAFVLLDLSKNVSAGSHSRHFYSAAIAVTAFRALGVYPGKIATPRIQTRVGGFVASVLGSLTARPPRLSQVCGLSYKRPRKTLLSCLPTDASFAGTA